MMASTPVRLALFTSLTSLTSLTLIACDPALDDPTQSEATSDLDSAQFNESSEELSRPPHVALRLREESRRLHLPIRPDLDFIFSPEVETPTEEEISYERAEIRGSLNLPALPFNYESEDSPVAFEREARLADQTAEGYVTDDDQATLGRVLFYDTALSLNESVSCASCHQQEIGFSDSTALSEGFDGALTGRNSMPIINVRYYSSGAMFWDERAISLEHQVLMPIQDEIEMGLSLPQLINRLESTSYYPILFELAFGDSEITAERISRALAQFNRAIVSYNSPYDRGLAQSGGDPRRPFMNFSREENRGKELFFMPPQDGGAGCAICHLAPPQGVEPAPGTPPPTSIFFVNGAVNNGLSDGRTLDEDTGLAAVTGREADRGKFKSPSLRQVGLTAPYMHDGSLETLRDVIDHYNEGVRQHPNLDRRLRQRSGAPLRLGLSEADKTALEAFLHTLTDEEIGVDERFANPFL